MSPSKAERELIMLSTAIASRRLDGGSRAASLAAGVDWVSLSGHLRTRRLLGTLGPRIVELADGQATCRFMSDVDTALAHGRRHGAFLELVSMRVAGALEEAGIRTSPLKGPLLSRSIYGDPGRRVSGDIDLLVADGDLYRAVEILGELGYAAPSDHVNHDGLPLLHFALSHRDGTLPPVELHWRIHWYERHFACDRLLAPARQAGESWRPSPADELAALLLFYARDGFLDLRLACDLGAWWDSRGGELAPGALGETVAAYPALARVIPTAAVVAQRVVAIPALDLLGEGHGLGVRGRVAARLADPHPQRSAPQLYADMGLVDWLLMPRGGFGAFVRRQLLLPREVLQGLDRSAPKRRARSRPGRLVGMLGRYGIALTRLLRRREGVRHEPPFAAPVSFGAPGRL